MGPQQRTDRSDGQLLGSRREKESDSSGGVNLDQRADCCIIDQVGIVDHDDRVTRSGPSRPEAESSVDRADEVADRGIAQQRAERLKSNRLHSGISDDSFDNHTPTAERVKHFGGESSFSDSRRTVQHNGSGFQSIDNFSKNVVAPKEWPRIRHGPAV